MPLGSTVPAGTGEEKALDEDSEERARSSGGRPGEGLASQKEGKK